MVTVTSSGNDTISSGSKLTIVVDFLQPNPRSEYKKSCLNTNYRVSLRGVDKEKDTTISFSIDLCVGHKANGSLQ